MALHAHIQHLARKKGIRNATKLGREANITYSYAKRLWDEEDLSHIPVIPLAAIAKLLGVKTLDLLVEEDE